MARQNEPNTMLGKNWIGRFLGRHPEIQSARNRALDASRTTAAILDMIERWFSHFSTTVERFKVAPRDIWNMDEIGYQLSHSQKESIIFDRSSGPPLSIASGSTG